MALNMLPSTSCHYLFWRLRHAEVGIWTPISKMQDKRLTNWIIAAFKIFIDFPQI